jgi:hypothetical protein
MTSARRLAPGSSFWRRRFPKTSGSSNLFVLTFPVKHSSPTPAVRKGRQSRRRRYCLNDSGSLADILTPAASTRAEDVAILTALIESLGAVVSTMEAEEHDRILAYVSHLPQLAVSALMRTVGSAVGEPGLGLAGGGLRDSSRLAASPASLWREIVESNADHVQTALDQLIATLEQLRNDRAAALPRIFDEAARWKQALERGQG